MIEVHRFIDLASTFWRLNEARALLFDEPLIVGLYRKLADVVYECKKKKKSTCTSTHVRFFMELTRLLEALGQTYCMNIHL